MIKKHIYMSFYNENDINTYPGIYSYHLGHREYEPNYVIGPTTIKYYTIHYVYSGEGTYIINGQRLDVTAGDVFIAKPGDRIKHKSSENKPWTLYWYEFGGDTVEAFFKSIGINECVIRQNNTILLDAFTECLSYCSANNKKAQLILESYLLRALHGIQMSLTSSFKLPSTQAIELAKIYMETRYDRKISMAEVAKYAGMDRSYFQRLFKEKEGIPPKEYFNSYRMKKAKELIKKGTSFKEISEILKINDISYFSKIFTRFIGITPMEYRRQILFMQKKDTAASGKRKPED